MSQSQRTLRRVLKHNEKSFQLYVESKVHCKIDKNESSTKSSMDLVRDVSHSGRSCTRNPTQTWAKLSPNSTRTEHKLDANSIRTFLIKAIP